MFPRRASSWRRTSTPSTPRRSTGGSSLTRRWLLELGGSSISASASCLSEVAGRRDVPSRGCARAHDLGHDAVAVGEIGLAGAADDVIYRVAADQDRVI